LKNMIFGKLNWMIKLKINKLLQKDQNQKLKKKKKLKLKYKQPRGSSYNF
jgi:hypothetical protein